LGFIEVEDQNFVVAHIQVVNVAAAGVMLPCCVLIAAPEVGDLIRIRGPYSLGLRRLVLIWRNPRLVIRFRFAGRPGVHRTGTGLGRLMGRDRCCRRGGCGIRRLRLIGRGCSVPGAGFRSGLPFLRVGLLVAAHPREYRLRIKAQVQVPPTTASISTAVKMPRLGITALRLGLCA
jgi:hypothetical protein